MPVLLLCSLLLGALFPQDPSRATPRSQGLEWLSSHHDGAGSLTSSPAGDALVLLALLGDGQVPGSGPQGEVLERGLPALETALRTTTDPEALALGTLVLIEAARLGGQPAPEEALARLEARLADTRIDEPGRDSTAFGLWASLALASSRAAGLEPAPASLASALGRVPFEPDAALAGPWSLPERSAAALLARKALGAGDDPARERAVGTVLAARPDAGSVLLLLGTWALADHADWKVGVAEEVLAGRARDGSWPATPGIPGGVPGATAWALLTLGSPFYSLP